MPKGSRADSLHDVRAQRYEASRTFAKGLSSLTWSLSRTSANGEQFACLQSVHLCEGCELRVGRLPSTATRWTILRLNVVTDIVDFFARFAMLACFCATAYTKENTPLENCSPFAPDSGQPL